MAYLYPLILFKLIKSKSINNSFPRTRSAARSTEWTLSSTDPRNPSLSHSLHPSTSVSYCMPSKNYHHRSASPNRLSMPLSYSQEYPCHLLLEPYSSANILVLFCPLLSMNSTHDEFRPSSIFSYPLKVHHSLAPIGFILPSRYFFYGNCCHYF